MNERIRELNTEFLDSQIVQDIIGGIRLFLSDSLTKVALGILIFMLLLAAFGPMITPYEYDERVSGEDGSLKILESPSADHLLGTTNSGQDVLSRLIYGARSTILTGFLAGGLIVSLGLLIGVSAGYYGGRIDSILMRITDAVFCVPFIPAAIVIVAFFGVGFWSAILVMGLLLWRGSARIFRSQVLQLKEQHYVMSARALGASDFYLIRKHILPNMGGMIMLFFALGVGISILVGASLSFLGLINPFVPSWGIILRNAYQSGTIDQAWWWALPPGFMIGLTVLSTFLLGRGYERLQQTDEVIVQ